MQDLVVGFVVDLVVALAFRLIFFSSLLNILCMGRVAGGRRGGRLVEGDGGGTGLGPGGESA